MKISCPACGREVDAEYVDLERGIAKCTGCDNVFSFGDKGGSSFLSLERPNIEMPKNFQIDNGFEGFVIRRKWIGPEVYILIFVCLLWDVPLIFLILSVKTFPFVMLPHLIIGVGLTYVVLAHLFNTTTITINCDAISVRHAPVPAFGEKTIARAGIQQVYSKKTIISPGWYALQYHPYWLNSYPYKTCGVNVIVNGGGDIKLIGGFCRKEDALFIEQQIEKYLGISNAPVPGELPR